MNMVSGATISTIIRVTHFISAFLSRPNIIIAIRLSTPVLTKAVANMRLPMIKPGCVGPVESRHGIPVHYPAHHCNDADTKGHHGKRHGFRYKTQNNKGDNSHGHLHLESRFTRLDFFLVSELFECQPVASQFKSLFHNPIECFRRNLLRKGHHLIQVLLGTTEYHSPCTIFHFFSEMIYG